MCRAEQRPHTHHAYYQATCVRYYQMLCAWRTKHSPHRLAFVCVHRCILRWGAFNSDIRSSNNSDYINIHISSAIRMCMCVCGGCVNAATPAAAHPQCTHRHSRVRCCLSTNRDFPLPMPHEHAQTTPRKCRLLLECIFSVWTRGSRITSVLMDAHVCALSAMMMMIMRLTAVLSRRKPRLMLTERPSTGRLAAQTMHKLHFETGLGLVGRGCAVAHSTLAYAF